jgi:hypothetical protein
LSTNYILQRYILERYLEVYGILGSKTIDILLHAGPKKNRNPQFLAHNGGGAVDFSVGKARAVGKSWHNLGSYLTENM